VRPWEATGRYGTDTAGVDKKLDVVRHVERLLN